MTIEIGNKMYGLSQIVNMTDGEILDLVYEIQFDQEISYELTRELTQTLLEWARNEATL